MLDDMYMRAEDMVEDKPEIKPVRKAMVVKINNRPLRVEEEEKDEKYGWTYVGVATIGYLLGFWVLDYAAHLFLGIHPFPFIKFVGVILSWFGIH